MSEKTNNIAIILIITLLIGVLLGLLLSENLFKTTVIFTDNNTLFQSTTENVVRKININTANTEELSLLPGVGIELAERIILYRQIHGPFISVDELENIEGIGKNKLEDISQYITIGG